MCKLRGGKEKMKRVKVRKINEKVGAWKDLQKILATYKEQEEPNHILLADLENMAKGYEQGIFKTCVEE